MNITYHEFYDDDIEYFRENIMQIIENAEKLILWDII